MPETTQTFNGGAAPMSQGAPPPDFANNVGDAAEKPIDGGAAKADPSQIPVVSSAEVKTTEPVGEVPKGGSVKPKK